MRNKLEKFKKEFLELMKNLPSVNCKRLCAGACGPIAISNGELALLEQAKNRKIETIEISGNKRIKFLKTMPDRHDEYGHCSMLHFDTHCSTYDVRPMICRIYGMVEDLKCGYGCEVTPHLMTRREAEKLYHDVMKLSEKYGFSYA